LIIKTNLFIPSRYSAITLWPFILVRPNASLNRGLIAHEMVHYREQAWIAPIWWLRYLLSKKFRLMAEVRAYKVSIQNGMGLAAAVYWLLSYKTGVTVEEATRLLRE